MGRFTWKKDRWEKEEFAGDGTKMVPVSGIRYGNWGVHKDGSEWCAALVTFNGRRAVSTRTRQEAMSFVEALEEANPAYLTIKGEDDFGRYVSGILKIRLNPKLWKKSGKLSLIEARTKVQEILSTNLKPLGTYSGKSGEFWGVVKSGDKVGRAISLGAKEVMLNVFFVEQRHAEEKQGSRWNMEDMKTVIELAMNERVLMAWIKWVQAGPTMKEIRQNVRTQALEGKKHPHADGGMRLATRIISRVARRHLAKNLQVRTVIPDFNLNTEELVQRIKSYGKDAQSSYSTFAGARMLRPEISMKEFAEIWDRVSPNAYVTSKTVNFVPTHISKKTKGVEIMVTQRTPGVVKYVLSYGGDGSEPAGMFDGNWKPIR